MCETNALYAKVGQALMTGTPDKSRVLLEAIIGSPQKEPKQLWTERTAKAAFVLGLLYFFPLVAGGLVAMVIPFIMFCYLPYHGLKSVFSWISSDSTRR